MIFALFAFLLKAASKFRKAIWYEDFKTSRLFSFQQSNKNKAQTQKSRQKVLREFNQTKRILFCFFLYFDIFVS